MVVKRYPLEFHLDRIREHPLIETATWLLARTSKEEMIQVLITVLGDPITKMQLEIFGNFKLQEYYPEPPCCLRCPCFDHLASKCRSHAHFGACVKPHLTDICIKKLKEGQPTFAKSPNCGDAHHAWNPICPERLHRLSLPSGKAILIFQISTLTNQSHPPSASHGMKHNTWYSSPFPLPSAPTVATPRTQKSLWPPFFRWASPK